MIRFTQRGVCGVRDALEDAAESMQAEIRRQGSAVERALSDAEKALLVARTEHARLTAERAAAGELSMKNQEALFAYEDRLGKTLTQLQTAQCEQTAAQSALEEAQLTLSKAQELVLPDEASPGFEMMKNGKRAAIHNAQKAMDASQKRFARAQSRMEQLNEKMAGAKPCMDLCKHNLRVLRELCSEISGQIRAIEQYVQAIEPLCQALPEERDARLTKMRAACKALEEPREMAKEAAACIAGYTQALDAITYQL